AFFNGQFQAAVAFVAQLGERATEGVKRTHLDVGHCAAGSEGHRESCSKGQPAHTECLLHCCLLGQGQDTRCGSSWVNLKLKRFKFVSKKMAFVAVRYPCGCAPSFEALQISRQIITMGL